MTKAALYRHLIDGGIPPISIAVNWSEVEKAHINVFMRDKKELTEEDIINVEKCLKDGEESIRNAVNEQYRSTEERIIIFTGCWNCEPLKKYLIKRGYKISPCGNNFDIWI